MKVFNFVRMMTSLGHEVIHYGTEGSTVENAEHVQLISAEEQRQLLGVQDTTRELYNPDWSWDKPHWQLLNIRVAFEIAKRARKHDFLCLITGTPHKTLLELLQNKLTPVEYGIGYTGVLAPFRAYESYALLHFMMGTRGLAADGAWYETVIPNYFDPDMWPLRAEKEDYLLYVGRLIQRKGVAVAADIAKRAKKRLLVGGQGCRAHGPGWLVCMDGTEMRAPGLEYVGFLDVQHRAEIMGRAQAVLVPTLYIEPFGGVAVEAQCVGTPVLTTDWGAFTETVEHGRTGFRCRTMEQFLWAADHVRDLDPCYIRKRAVDRYSMWNVRYMYQEFFDMLRDVQAGNGWYAERQRTSLNWLGPYPIDTTNAQDHTDPSPCAG